MTSLPQSERCPEISDGGVMTSGVPVVLIASRSPGERLSLESTLAKTGRRVYPVANPAEAEFVCAKYRGASTLVIDSDLLEEPRDAEWRRLRGRYPELATVVRCPVASDRIQRTDHNTVRVHPSNGDGVHEALDILDTYHTRVKRTF